MGTQSVCTLFSAHGCCIGDSAETAVIEEVVYNLHFYFFETALHYSLLTSPEPSKYYYNLFTLHAI